MIVTRGVGAVNKPLLKLWLQLWDSDVGCASAPYNRLLIAGQILVTERRDALPISLVRSGRHAAHAML